MTELTISLHGVQHIKSLRYTFDLDRYGLIALVGKNGAGKSTLARALRTLSFADTFEKTASGNIFNAESRIDFVWGGKSLTFSYDPSLKLLNCRQSITRQWRRLVSCELSIPHGDRFHFFGSISGADLDIRRALILGDYTVPEELIAFLRSIYANNKFDDLVEIRVKKASYFCLHKPNERYVREDYFSSGEYFLVSLYRRLRSGYKLIFIDEIDISLDAAAQARLVPELRRLCSKYCVTVAFTTHSLALMKTLDVEELNYMEAMDGEVLIRPASYNFVKSLLFAFRGWDKYILTEDDVLKDFLEHVITHFCSNLFFRYIIIYVGGSGNVTDMLRRNSVEGFFGDVGNVIAVLDGDQAETRQARGIGTLCIPIENVEKALQTLYLKPDFRPRLDPDTVDTNPKALFKQILKQRLMTKRDIFDRICAAHDAEIRAFANQLQTLLSRA